MNKLHIVKIFYMFKIVLHFELLKNTKIIYIQPNGFTDNFTGFLQFLDYF